MKLKSLTRGDRGRVAGHSREGMRIDSLICVYDMPARSNGHDGWIMVKVNDEAHIIHRRQFIPLHKKPREEIWLGRRRNSSNNYSVFWGPKMEGSFRFQLKACEAEDWEWIQVRRVKEKKT